MDPLSDQYYSKVYKRTLAGSKNFSNLPEILNPPKFVPGKSRNNDLITKKS